MASQFINLKSRLLNPYVVFAVWMLCTVWICITQSLAGPQNYNNFLVFRGVFDHLFSSLPLYEPYPLEYGDINHYGPIFAFIIAPFAVLPPWLGMSLWCMSLSLLLYWTVRQLPMPVVLTSLVLWLTLNDFYGACFKQQFNIAVAALVVGALAMIEKRREGWAALFIVIGTFVKIYGIVGLAFFFFVRRKGRFIGYMALWSAMALLLPLLFVSPEYLWSQYAAWAADIVQKNGENMFCAYTNISLVGCVRKISGSPAYSDLLIIVPAMVLFLLSYLRTGQYKHFSYRLTMLASLLLFIVLFSSGSEHSGYVIAALGMGIWGVNFPPPPHAAGSRCVRCRSSPSGSTASGGCGARISPSRTSFWTTKPCLRQTRRQTRRQNPVPRGRATGSTSYARVTIRLRGSSLRWPAPMRSFAPGIRTSACT